MNENVVSFETALELEEAGFPQEITKGQFRYTTEGEKVLVGEVLHQLRLLRWVHEKKMWSTSQALPIETPTIYAPNAKDIWTKLPAHFQPDNLTQEDEFLQVPDKYAVLWIEENPR